MAPPKKDVFADLFQTANPCANTNSNKLSLLERQTAAKGTEMSNGRNIAGSNNSSWSNLDFLSGQDASSVNSGAGSTRSMTPQTQQIPKESKNDPFDIFNLTEPRKAEVGNNINIPNNRASHSSGSLLDDDFIDAFPEVKTKTPERTPEAINRAEKLVSYEDIPPPVKETKVNANNSTSSVNSMGKKDHVLAELIDIGFSVDDANEAIQKIGLDLQECVNYIMNKGNPKNTERNTRSSQRNQSPLGMPNDGDIAAKLNGLSNDLFNKASFFLNKSKDTVIKNIKQYQDGLADSPDQNLPAWMRSQHRYKADAIEKKYKEEGAEDYGSDEDNINKDAINEFMRSQREKDKEKAKLRYNNWKQMAKESITSNRNTPSPRTGSSSEVSSNLVPSKSRSPLPNLANTHKKEPLQHPQPEKLSALPKKEDPQPSMPEVDLLGLNELTSRSQSFKKSGNTEEGMYVPSSRRRARLTRKTVSTPLNEFEQSDYTSSKERATELFTNGDYDNALKYYLRALEVLPPKHELRIIMNSNVSINYIKLGDYKKAKEHCDTGLELIDKEDINNSGVQIGGKPVKSWYIKLLSRRAESLEMLESFNESLSNYVELIQLGVNDKKIMDGKRRVNNICNPPSQESKPKPKPKPTPQVALPITTNSSKSSTSRNENLSKLKERDNKAKIEEQRKFELHDSVHERLHQWSNGKEDNIRSLLLSLPSILPERLGFPFLTTKKLTMNDLMLPKKVKINYMKVISNIHPDKSGNLDIEDKMLCQGAFITLNKSWDIFKEQNGMN